MKRAVGILSITLCMLLVMQLSDTNNFVYAYGDETISEDGWSNWSDSQVYSEFGTQERTLYRSSKKLEKISESSALPGWTCEETLYEWSPWGEWSEWMDEEDYPGDSYFESDALNICEGQWKNGQFRYRWKTVIAIKYKHYKWENWSEWNEKKVVENENLKVETKKQYRGKLFGNTNDYMNTKMLTYDKVSLSWTSIPGAEWYYIYKRETGASTWKFLANTEDTQAVFRLSKAGSYEFCIRPCRFYNYKLYLGSKVLMTEIHSFGMASQPKIFLTGQDTIKVSWKETEGANQYDLYYKKIDEPNWRKKDVAGNFCYLNLSNARGTYEFRIQPFYESGTTLYCYPGYSDVNKFTFMTKNTLKIVKNNKISIKLTWNKGQGKKDGFEIYRAAGANRKYAKIKTINSNAGTKAVIVQKAKGKKYYYKIRPYRVVNGEKIYGPYSNVKSIKL